MRAIGNSFGKLAYDSYGKRIWGIGNSSNKRFKPLPLGILGQEIYLG
jgi:hypothetical protein